MYNSSRPDARGVRAATVLSSRATSEDEIDDDCLRAPRVTLLPWPWHDVCGYEEAGGPEGKMPLLDAKIAGSLNNKEKLSNKRRIKV